MGHLSKFVLGLAAAWLARAVPMTTNAEMGSIIITADNTVNDTNSVITMSEASNPLSIKILNNYGSETLHVYVTGTDSNGDVVMLTTGNKWHYPSTTKTTPVKVPASANVAIPLAAEGKNKTITLPGYCVSCRLWIAQGNLTFYTVASSSGTVSLVEPSAVNPDDASADIKWGFVEFDYEDDIYANLSFVDFVGLVLGMSLKTTDGGIQMVKGLKKGSIANICTALADQQTTDGYPWGDMCMFDKNGNAVRALSPNLYISDSTNSDAFDGYYASYLGKVWDHYTDNTLTINTQASAGDVACKVNSSTNKLKCDGDNRGYAKPTVADIFGCNSGPFLIESTDNAVHSAVVARLCAALDRSTLLLDGGDVQPSLSDSKYYTVSPTNHYSRIVHDYELDGKGYAFSYDDVDPSGQNDAGVVSGTPSLLHIVVGGWTS